jgi:PAS domain S-box-containing protein
VTSVPRFQPDANEVLRRRDEYVRRLFEHAHDSIHIVDEHGVSVFDTSSRVLGHEVTDFVGHDNSHLLHPEDRDRALAALHDVFRTGKGGPVEYRIKHKDGSYRWYEAIGTRYVDEDGRVLAIINTREITDRVIAQQEMRKLQEELRQSQKLEEIGRLAGGVAHDFNNLLSVILGYAEQLEDLIPPDSPARADLDEIKKAGHRGAELTRRLLAFSRKQVLRPRVTSVNDIVSDTTQMLARLIGPNIQLDTWLAADLQPVLVDPSQIQQVLVNLAVNARDAMPHGGTIQIRTRNVRLRPRSISPEFPTTGGDFVQLMFSDTGSGIAPDVMPLVFEPFFTTKPEGTGLGLPMIYGILKQSGGEIAVESTIGVGTTFRMYLPPSR